MNKEKNRWFLCRLNSDMKMWTNLSDWEVSLIYFAVARHNPKDWIAWQPSWPDWRRVEDLKELFAKDQPHLPISDLPMPN